VLVWGKVGYGMVLLGIYVMGGGDWVLGRVSLIGILFSEGWARRLKFRFGEKGWVHLIGTFALDFWLEGSNLETESFW
jgi:hypothetical protein